MFCLSLLGTNFPEFIVEANRVLKPSGKLFIAEVLSRFEDIEKFSSHHMLHSGGFKLLKINKLKDFFYIMVFKKVEDVQNRLELGDFASQLKPCLYKRR